MLWEGPGKKGDREPYLAFDQLLGHFDGCFTEGSTILGTDLCTNCEERRVIAVCLESKGEHRGEGGGGSGKGEGRGLEGGGREHTRRDTGEAQYCLYLLCLWTNISTKD